MSFNPQMDASGNLLTPANLAMTVPASVAAAGSVQGDAASISYGVQVVTASDGTKGVKLPTAVPGRMVVVVNSVNGQNLKIYPASGGAIDYAAADAAYTLSGRKHAVFVATSPTQWYTVLTA